MIFVSFIFQVGVMIDNLIINPVNLILSKQQYTENKKNITTVISNDCS